MPFTLNSDICRMRSMEHIKHALRERERSLFLLRQQEKGSREWNAFNNVRDDRIAGYPVRKPQKPMVAKSSDHVLRIIPLPFPHRLHLRHAH